jgi:hypothetical protein
MSTVIPPSPSQRVSYRNGILLDASDFQQEQHYHRSRLAIALGSIHGLGTIAGLKVEHFAAGTLPEGSTTPRSEDQLVVRPGIALDRAGRLIEITGDQCLRLNRWLLHQLAQPAAALKPYRDPTDRRYFVGDLFLRYNENAQGLRPGFPEPAADATDSIVPSRTNDSFELKLITRDCDPETTLPALPLSRFPAPTANRAALLAAVYAAYPNPDHLIPGYPDELGDTNAVFLSRVRIRLEDAPATSLTRHASNEVVIDDIDRPIVTSTDLLAHLLPV